MPDKDPTVFSISNRSIGVAPSGVIPHLQEHLLYVREPQPFVPRSLKGGERVKLARCDLILFKLIRRFEECPHVLDECFGHARWHLNVLGHGF
jgi:hypothetical protein